MPVRRALEGTLPAQLAGSGVPIFAHTVNDYGTMARLLDVGLRGVYTDWLSPTDRDRSGPLPEWSVTTSGELPIGRRLAPFISWGMDGMETTCRLRSLGESDAVVRVSVRGSDGTILKSESVPVSRGSDLRLNPMAAVSGGGGHGWIEVEATEGLDAELKWTYGARSDGELTLTGIAVDRFETTGSGAGLGGLLVAIVNPTDVLQTYRLRRLISSRVVDDETIDVRPETQMVRVYRSWTDDEIVISLSGGPMVVQTLRWDHLARFMR
jgi:hypothetical protein